MSERYDNYIQEHKSNVIKGYNWLKGKLPDIFDENILNDCEDRKSVV